MSQQCFKNINPTGNLSLNVKHMQSLFSKCLLGSQGDPKPSITTTAERNHAALLGGGSVRQGHSLVSSADLVWSSCLFHSKQGLITQVIRLSVSNHHLTHLNPVVVLKTIFRTGLSEEPRRQGVVWSTLLPDPCRKEGLKFTLWLPVYLRRQGRERAAGPVMCHGCGRQAPVGHWEHPCRRVVVVVVHRRWPGPVSFHSQGSSKLQVLIGERQRAICEICAPMGRVPG